MAPGALGNAGQNDEQIRAGHAADDPTLKAMQPMQAGGTHLTDAGYSEAEHGLPEAQGGQGGSSGASRAPQQRYRYQRAADTYSGIGFLPQVCRGGNTSGSLRAFLAGGCGILTLDGCACLLAAIR